MKNEIVDEIEESKKVKIDQSFVEKIESRLYKDNIEKLYDHGFKYVPFRGKRKRTIVSDNKIKGEEIKEIIIDEMRYL